jgi:hypothetical protein
VLIENVVAPSEGGLPDPLNEYCSFFFSKTEFGVLYLGRYYEIYSCTFLPIRSI